LTSGGEPRTLASVHRRIAAWRLGTETALLAALLVAMVPAFVLDALERALPALSVAVAVPAAADTRAVEAVLRQAGVRRDVGSRQGERTAELWAALDAAGAPPTVVAARLWPAAAVDGAALARRLAEAVPDAVVDLRPEPPAAPTATLAAALGLGALAAATRWRLARTVRRLLKAEAATLVLIHRFGATRAWTRAQVARPIVRRAGSGAVAGAGVGAAAGLAVVAAGAVDLLRPSSGIATVVLASNALAATLTAAALARVVAATTARRLEAAASAAA
jgi:hypothetical protein